MHAGASCLVPRASSSGFSLIETLITAALLVVLSGVVMLMYVHYNAFFARQSASIDMLNTASRLANRVHTAVAQAIAIADSHTSSGTLYTSSSDTLVLQLPAQNASGDAVPAVYDYFVYYATGTMAYEIVDAGAGSVRRSGTTQLSSTVDSLTFTYESTPSISTWVELDFHAEATIRAETTATHITERSYLRN